MSRSSQRTASVEYSPIEHEYVTSLLMPARCRLVLNLQIMESAESVITQFNLHLQIHSSKSTNLKLAVILIVLNQRDVFSYFIHNSFGELHADSISVFGRFWSPRVISAYYSPFSKSCRFLTLINAFLRLRRKKAWDGKKLDSDADSSNLDEPCDNYS